MSLTDTMIRKVLKENTYIRIWKPLEMDHQTKYMPNRIYSCKSSTVS